MDRLSNSGFGLVALSIPTAADGQAIKRYMLVRGIEFLSNLPRMAHVLTDGSRETDDAREASVQGHISIEGDWITEETYNRYVRLGAAVSLTATLPA